MPEVAIIMPAYNAQDTVERAVRSVFAQDFDDWELIVVDDGSSDSTAEILKELSSEFKDERLKLILGEPNRGPSGARNRGLEEASGKWLTFLDSDDEFNTRRISAALTCAKDPIDIIVCRHEIKQLNAESRIRGLKKSASISGREMINGVLSERISNYSWDKFFRASRLGKIRFRKMQRAEDKVHTIECSTRARRIAFVSYPGIKYYVSPDSLTWGRISSVAETELLITALDEIVSSLPRKNKTELALRANRTLSYLSVAHQHLFQKSDPSSLRGRFSFADVAATALFQPVFAAAGMIFKVSPSLYSWLYKNYIGKKYGL